VSATPVDAAAGTFTVDTHLLGMPGVGAAYLLEGDRTALIDAGAAPAVEHLLAALDERGHDPADLDELLLTHAHLDHAGAAGDIAARCPNATVRVHERGRPYLTEIELLDRLVAGARDAMGDLADAYGEPSVVPAGRCEPLSGGDVVDLGDRRLDIVGAPGHAPHQVCFHDDRTDVLFAGDAAGMAVAGELHPTTPPPDFDLDASLATVRRLRERDPGAICFGHFGHRDDAAEVLGTYESLLPAWVDAVEDAVAAVGRDRAAVVDALSGDWNGPTLARDVAGVLASLD
jgi:glyoxylase-like metal-dependent hydrolase (beta-lactamase superfamily II)